MSTSEINFSCSLANPIIRSAIKTHIEEIKWDSILAKKILDMFSGKTVSGSGVLPPATIRSHLSAENLLEDEIENIIVKCNDYTQLGKNIDDFIKSFNTFYKRKMISSILAESNQSPDDTASEIERRIKNLKTVESNVVPIYVLGDLDYETVMREDLGGEDSVLPTFSNLMRTSCPLGGYLRGQVIQVVGAPGTGKSLFLMNEAINMVKNGFKGVYFALGDLMRLDFLDRFSAIISKTSFTDVQRAQGKYWNTNEVKSPLKNLKIVVEAAGNMTADELADVLESRIQEEENVDFVVVDYDSNFAKTMESMYEEGAAVYDKMSSISRPKNSKFRVVLIASQPKEKYWEFEKLPLSAANESSRKQAIIDIMVTLGKAASAIRRCGILNIPKNRRGIPDMSTPYVVEPWGELKEIDQGEYNLMRTYSSEDKGFKKNYDYAQ